MTPEDEGIIDNQTGKKFHDCKQEKRLERIESDQRYLAKQHENTLKELKNTNKSIDERLTQIWQEVKEGDKDNLKTIIAVILCFVGAIVTLTVAFIAIIRFA